MGRREQRELTLLAKVDEGTIKRSIARMNELSRGFNAVADAEVRLDRTNAKAESGLGTLNATTQANVTALRQRIATTKLDIQAQQDALNITKKQTGAIEQQTRAQDKLNKEKIQSRSISGAERAGSISSFTGSISALAGGSSGLGQAFNIVSDLTQVAEYLPRLGEALTGVKAAGEAAEVGAIATSTGLKGLVLTLGPIAAVAAAAAIAYVVISKELKAGKTAAEEAAKGERLLAELRIQGTEDIIQSRIEAANSELKIAEETRRRFNELLNEIIDEQYEKGGTFRSTAEREELLKLRDAEDEKIKELNETLGILNSALGETEIVTRAAAKAQEELSAALLKHVEGAIAEEIKYRELAAEATREQVEDRIESIQRETAAIEEQLERLKAPGETTPAALDAIRVLEERLEGLTNEEERLSGEILKAVSAREKELKAIEDATAALEKSAAIEQARADFEESLAALEAKTLAERKAIIQRTNDELTKIEARRLEQVGKLEREFNTSEARAERDFNLTIEKLQRESGEQEESIKSDSAQRINDLEERAARERQRILDDYNDAASDAIQNRDAVALDAAVRTRNRALKDTDRDLKLGVKQEKTALKERLEEARRSNALRITDLRAAYAIERADRYADFQQRLNAINAQADQERAIIQVRQAEALAALAERNQEELAKLKEGFADQLEEYGVFFTDLQAKTAAELLALAIKWETYFRRIALAGSSTTSGSGIANQPGANTGGINPTPAARGIKGFRDGLLMAGEDEPELMRVKNGAVDVLSGSSTRSVFSGMGRAMSNYNTRTVNIAAGAFQANMSGVDPVRMALEVERRVAKRLPVLFERMLEAELGNG